jgi:O-acetylhomoserine (thiol)-lyase
VTLPRLGITSFVDSSDVLISRKRQEKIRRSFCREFGKSKIRRIRFEIYFGGSQETESSFIVDNGCITFLLNPIEHGATIVIHSLNISQEMELVRGVIIDGGNFDWSSGKFPSLQSLQQVIMG